MKIVILDGHAVNPGDLSWDFLKEFGEVTVYERTPEDRIAAHIGDSQIVLLNKAPITRAVLDACPNIQLLCVLATGYNVVDLAECRKRGIPVCNVPDYGTAAVAQFTLALLLELCHRIGHHDDAVHAGKWSDCADFCFWDTPQRELAGKRMGIIGFGRIGQAVAKLAQAFGMETVACSRSRKRQDIAPYVTLEELLSTSDVVSLHCPLTPETRKLICTDALRVMKDGAILLNTARGDIIDEQAVAMALRTGKLAGAAVDVVSREPISPDSPLLTAPNCIITPHMAWAPIESRKRIQECTVKNIRAFMRGHPVNTV